MTRVCHLTSVHERDDIRIFMKQCRTLAASGFDTTLIVADGQGDETRDGVAIRDAGRRPLNRAARMALLPRRLLHLAIKADCQIYHLHDPELLPLGLALKRRGRKVVFDSHEDYVADIRIKPYLKFGTAGAASNAFANFVRLAARRIDLVVAATPAVAKTYRAMEGVVVETVNNYPLAEEIARPRDASAIGTSVVYAGAITRVRGFPRTVDAMALCRSEARLELIGPFTDPAAEAGCRASTGWLRTSAHGRLARADMMDQMECCAAGIVVLEPVPTFLESRPNKMFEYMSRGLAVIASDFPLWREIIEGNRCGICVDPLDARAIAAAIDLLVGDRELAAQMGRLGRQAILDRFSWLPEGRRLVDIYKRLEDA